MVMRVEHNERVRLTLAIDDRLVAAAKRRARQRGITLGQLVEEALRAELAGAAPSKHLPIPVFRGRGGVRAGVDVTSSRALLEALDEGRQLEQLR
jgi:hypothetical protein